MAIDLNRTYTAEELNQFTGEEAYQSIIQPLPIYTNFMLDHMLLRGMTPEEIYLSGGGGLAAPLVDLFIRALAYRRQILRAHIVGLSP